ncbi:MAG: PAS domain S-box protein, partial [Gammaproteobacteria bacterium]
MIYCLLWPEFAPAQVSVQTPLTTTSFSVPLWLLGLLALSFLGLAALVTKYVYKLKSRLSAIESDLARSSAEWSYAMDFLEDPMYLVDLNDRLIRANRAFYKQIGKTPAQALGQDVRTLIHLKPEKTPCPACAARLERRDAFFTKEADDPTNPTGRPIEVTIRVVKDDSGNPIGIFQGLRDLSHLRETEQALRESQQRLANAQRIARVGNWDWNFTTDELICSTELCNIFGLKPVAAAVSMETLISQLPLNEKTTFRNTLALAIESGKAHALDHRLTLPDTNPRYIHQEIHVNKNNDGRILSISGTAQDVTDTKLAEKALYEEKEKAQITLRSIG